MQLIANILAVYRLAQLLSKDAGPLDVFETLREHCLLAAQAARPGTLRQRVLVSLSDLVQCPYCLGVWFAVLVTVIRRVKCKPIQLLLDAVALAGGQCLLQEIVDNGTRPE